jgi:hypothetical protein
MHIVIEEILSRNGPNTAQLCSLRHGFNPTLISAPSIRVRIILLPESKCYIPTAAKREAEPPVYCMKTMLQTPGKTYRIEINFIITYMMTLDFALLADGTRKM